MGEIIRSLLPVNNTSTSVVSMEAVRFGDKGEKISDIIRISNDIIDLRKNKNLSLLTTHTKRERERKIRGRLCQSIDPVGNEAVH